MVRLKEAMARGAFAVLFLVFAASGASAFTQINIYIDSSGDALFLGESDEEFLDLPPGISYEDGKIRGYTSELTGKIGDVWIFSFTLIGAEMNIILPDGARITKIDEGDIYLNRGNIAVYVQERINVSYVIEEAEKSLFENLVAPLVVAGAIFFAIIVVFFINYFRKSKDAMTKQETEKKDKFESIRGVLNERERIIIDKLKQVGKVKGSYLRSLCDIPKASFSRHVQELEKKGLVKRTGEGKNKFVELNG